MEIEWEKGVRMCDRNGSVDTKVKEGEGGGAPGAGAEIPLQPMVRQDVLLQLLEIHGEADIHLQPMEELTPEQVDAQRRL
ncbi:protein pxr1-like [Pitangus sulphuratus]|nr:protein pxr1-like [Pitangus sulphuratus]